LLLLSGVWVDSVAMSKCQHSSRIVLDLLVECTTLNVKRGGFRERQPNGVEPPILNDVSPATKLLGVLALRLDISPSSYSRGLPGALDKNGNGRFSVLILWYSLSSTKVVPTIKLEGYLTNTPTPSFNVILYREKEEVIWLIQLA
jgi:hypothetical protein